MDGYFCIRRCANKHTMLKSLMKQQTKKTGFSRSESRLAIGIIVEARNSPLSQSAKSLTLTPSTSEMKIIDQEFCVGLDHVNQRRPISAGSTLFSLISPKHMVLSVRPFLSIFGLPKSTLQGDEANTTTPVA